MKRLHTPWGMADGITEVGMGILCVQTPSHGGYYVPDSVLHQIPHKLQVWAAECSGSRNWYEEDCCWAAVCYAFPYLFPLDAIPIANKVLKGVL
jgi:hypothetical protein